MESTNSVILLTPTEASEKFFHGKKSYSAMVSAARKNQLPSLRVGNRIFFEENSLKNFFLEQISCKKSTDSKVVNGIERID